MLKDITRDVIIRAHPVKADYKPFDGTVRISMIYEGCTIAVLKSKGWDIMPLFTVKWLKHPTAKDDSWFRVFMQTI